MSWKFEECVSCGNVPLEGTNVYGRCDSCSDAPRFSDEWAVGGLAYGDTGELVSV